MRKLKRSLAFIGAGTIAFANLAFAAVTPSLIPTSAGAYSQWTPNTGSTHYTLVDESTCNGTTDYVRTTTVGQRDSFGISLSSIPDGSQISQISITPCASRNSSGGGSSTMNVFYRLNGVNSADAGSYNVTGTTPVSLSATAYGSLTTFKSSATTLEIGAVYSAGTKGVRLSKLATIITYSAHLAPSGLSATYSTGNISLVWTDNSAVEDGFKIERSTDGGAYSQIDTASANAVAYTDTTATADHSYTYRVRAYNATADTSYSNISSSVTTLPSSPSTLAATPSGTNVSLTWTDNSAIETGFKVERSTDGVNFTQIKTVGANVVATTATGGTTNTQYTFRIRAYNATGNSDYSNTATASTTPNAPSSLSASYSAGTVTLNWTDNSAVEDGFKIERSTDGGAYSQIDTAAANATTYGDTTVSPNYEYNYRIRAYNAAGNSAYTSVAYIHTYSIAADPTNLVATLSGSTTIALTWTDNSSNEKYFFIERKVGAGSFSQIATVNANVGSYTNYLLSGSTLYTYRVRANNPAGNSGYTNEASQTTP